MFRRRWREDAKRSILGEVGVNGASVADFARVHDITRQHIDQWRQELMRRSLLERPNSPNVTFRPLIGRTLEPASDAAEGTVEV